MDNFTYPRCRLALYLMLAKANLHLEEPDDRQLNYCWRNIVARLHVNRHEPLTYHLWISVLAPGLL